MASIRRPPGAIGLWAAAVFIPFQRHPATLAILIDFVHNLERRLNLIALFLSRQSIFQVESSRPSFNQRNGLCSLAEDDALWPLSLCFRARNVFRSSDWGNCDPMCQS